jgi:hypothetical protein
MSERYIIVREDGLVLCRCRAPPGTAWCVGEGPGLEAIRLTKEGAEQMARTVGGVTRKVSS